MGAKGRENKMKKSEPGARQHLGTHMYTYFASHSVQLFSQTGEKWSVIAMVKEYQIESKDRFLTYYSGIRAISVLH